MAKNLKGKAVSFAFAKSQKKGTNFVSVVFKCEDDHCYEWQGYFTDNTNERTISSLRIMGCTFPGDDVTNLAGFDSNEVSLKIEDGEYGERVSWVNPIGGVSEENKMDEASKKGFAASMKGTLLRLKGTGPKLAAVPAAAPWQAPTGERSEESGGHQMQATGTDNPNATANKIPF